MFGRYTGRELGQRAFDRRKFPLLIGTVALGSLFVFSASSWSGSLQKTIEILGICTIIICIVGRTWCSFFITGHKTYELIKVGPYSIIRHPLYAFSIIGAAGVGGQSGTVSLAIISAAYIAIVLRGRIWMKNEKCFAYMGIRIGIIWRRCRACCLGHRRGAPPVCGPLGWGRC